MIRTFAVTAVAAVVGAGLALSYPYYDQEFAAAYSQSIYDCGIRIASGAEGGTVSGFKIMGHKMGLCLGGVNNNFEHLTIEGI